MKNGKSLRENLRDVPSFNSFETHPNDYIGSLRVTRAKLESTKQKRLTQMLEELKKGGVYMRMKWSGS